MSEFQNAKFMSAADKAQVADAWHRFVTGGFRRSQFTKALYNHLIMHCSFIAHYNLDGFFGVYFDRPEATDAFLNQFDEKYGFVSVEYGYAGWFRDPDYADLNRAMVETLAPLLPKIRRQLHEQLIADANKDVEAAQARRDRLVAKGV